MTVLAMSPSFSDDAMRLRLAELPRGLTENEAVRFLATGVLPDDLAHSPATREGSPRRVNTGPLGGVTGEDSGGVGYTADEARRLLTGETPLVAANYNPRQYRGPAGRWAREGGVVEKIAEATRSGGREFTDPGDAKSFLQDHYGGWRDSLSPAEDSGLRFYQSPGFALMNGQLRGLDPKNIKADVSFNESDLARARKASIDLKKAIAKAPPLDEHIIVHRGFSADQFGDLRPGMKIRDKGFTSTSLTPDVTSVGKATKPGEMHITVPKGFRAGAGSARELILPPDTEFEVAGVRDVDGVTHVDARVVPR